MPETIGQQLKRERESRFLTLEKASEATRIRSVFLQALEADDYSVMPSAAQGRGFLRNYAEYLDLNIDELIAEIQRSAPQVVEVSGPLPQVNLAETELPPLDAEDEPLQRFSWVGRLLAALFFWRKDKAGEMPGEPNQVEAVEGVEPESGWGVGEVIRGFFKKKEDLPVAEVILTETEIPRYAPSQPADVIFVEIGALLRERRELISLTFDEVERHTKLRAAFVRALEDGALDKLPSPVQTRGMLANYATFLDLDTESILLRFADGLQARRYEKYAETPREKIQTEVVASIPLWRNFIAGDLIFGALMIAVLFALAVWGLGRAVRSQAARDAVEPTAPSIVEALVNADLPTPSLEATFVPLDEDTTATPGLETVEPQVFNANVTVEVFAVERTFLRVAVDGEQVFEGRLAPGESKVFEANEQVAALTGNAAALRVSYNGRDLGLMGAEGEVVSRVYLVSGVATPTATISPTPTNTLSVTLTPVPSPSPAVTATPTPGG